jgi:hypothetical protein
VLKPEANTPKQRVSRALTLRLAARWPVLPRPTRGTGAPTRRTNASRLKPASAPRNLAQRSKIPPAGGRGPEPGGRGFGGVTAGAAGFRRSPARPPSIGLRDPRPSSTRSPYAPRSMDDTKPWRRARTSSRVRLAYERGSIRRQIERNRGQVRTIQVRSIQLNPPEYAWIVPAGGRAVAGSNPVSSTSRKPWYPGLLPVLGTTISGHGVQYGVRFLHVTPMLAHAGWAAGEPPARREAHPSRFGRPDARAS